MPPAKVALWVISFGLLVGCAESEPKGTPGAAGTGDGGTAGTSATGRGGDSASGVAGSSAGGSSAGTAGASGQSGGGSGGAGGSAGSTGGAAGNTGGSTGGSSAGAMAGRGGSPVAGRGGAGAGGSASAGSGGSTGVAGDSGSGGASPPMPSAGCGKSGRPSGGKVEVAGQSLHLFPTSYDGGKPFPLLIALHACGNQNTEFVNPTNGSGFDTNFVRTFPNTPDSGQCWSNYTGDIARILAQYDDLMANYCIDKSRVFATGHSSGAQMLVNILSHKTDAQHMNIKGVAPVAADPYTVRLLRYPSLNRAAACQRRYVRGSSNISQRREAARGASLCVTTQALPAASGRNGGPWVESNATDVSGDTR